MRGQEKYIFVIVYCCKKNACVERKQCCCWQNRAGRASARLFDAGRSIYGARSLAVCAERCYNILGKIKVGGLAQHTVSTQWLMIRARGRAPTCCSAAPFFHPLAQAHLVKFSFYKHLCCCCGIILCPPPLHSCLCSAQWLHSISKSTNEMHGGAFFVYRANASRQVAKVMEKIIRAPLPQ